MKKVFLNTNWKMRQIGTRQYINAQVPGSVYCDLLAAEMMNDPYYKDNEDEALKLMDYDYEYITYFVCDDELINKSEVMLVFEGLDTLADIYLNGVHISSTNNMHRTYKYPIKRLLRSKDRGDSILENELKVVFHSPTQFIAEAYAKAPTRGTEDAMDGFVHIRKAHYMFGWDWGAHLPDAGIWKPVYLQGIEKAKIETVYVGQIHDDNVVTLKLRPKLNCVKDVSYDAKNDNSCFSYLDDEYEINYILEDPDGEIVSQGNCSDHILVKEPKLWWPNGFGKQNLYSLTIKLSDKEGNVLDIWTRRIGLRTITMDTSADKWGEKFATCINGKNIFAMGADYIPQDHLLGRVNEEATRELLQKAIFANFNSIRVWGGGHYPQDWFYDICDELGLIVWQDFMFACAVYDLTPDFEENIKAELIDNIERLRHHASLGLFCGNNEMESFVKDGVWVSKDSEVSDYLTMYEKLMPDLLKEYAPDICYRPSSPSSGGGFDNPQDENRGDVHYWDVWHGNKPFSEYRKFHFRYLSEFGFQSFPSKKTFELITDDERDLNIFSYICERHQRNGSANGKIMNYMQQTYRYPTSFEDVVYASQLLQADAIRYGVEHFRRNRNEDRCMGAVYWQFNDCWPVASWSSVDYAQRLKALHYYARRFFAPIMISCEEEGMLGSGQELVRLPFDFSKSIRLNVTNETFMDENILVRWQLRDAEANILREEETTVLVSALSSVWLERVEFTDIDIYTNYVSYFAIKGGEVISEGTVIFSYPKYFRYVNPSLRYSVEGNAITVSARSFARSVMISNDNEDLILSDNYFDLNGDSKTVEVISGDYDNIKLKSVYDIG